MKKLKKMWDIVKLPVVLLAYLVLQGIRGHKKSKKETEYLLRQTAIAWFAVAFYADVFLLAFFASDFALSFVGQAVSYVLDIWSLPQWSFNEQSLLALFAAFIAVLHMFKISYRSFIISVPAYSGVLTVNYFRGRFEKYGQGAHLKWPQERFDQKLAFSLELITFQFTDSYVTSDGAVASINGSARYAPSFDRLEAYGGVDDRTIGLAILNIARADLTTQISKRVADDVRKHTAKIKKIIEAKYKGIAKVERELGFDLIDFTLANIGFDAESQKALTATFARKVMFAGLEDNPQAREDVLALAGGKIQKTVNQWRVDGKVSGLEDIGPALTALLASWSASKGSPKPTTP